MAEKITYYAIVDDYTNRGEPAAFFAGLSMATVGTNRSDATWSGSSRHCSTPPSAAIRSTSSSRSPRTRPARSSRGYARRPGRRSRSDPSAAPAGGPRSSALSTGLSAVISVAPVIDIQDVDLLAVLIDRVPDAVLTAPCPPVPLERRTQWGADSSRFLRQWTADELVAGPGDGLRQPFLQLSGGRGRHHDLIGHGQRFPKRPPGPLNLVEELHLARLPGPGYTLLARGLPAAQALPRWTRSSAATRTTYRGHCVMWTARAASTPRRSDSLALTSDSGNITIDQDHSLMPDGASSAIRRHPLVGGLTLNEEIRELPVPWRLISGSRLSRAGNAPRLRHSRSGRCLAGPVASRSRRPPSAAARG